MVHPHTRVIPLKANDKRRKPGARLPIYCPEKMNLIVVKAHFVAENHMDRLLPRINR